MTSVCLSAKERNDASKAGTLPTDGGLSSGIAGPLGLVQIENCVSSKNDSTKPLNKQIVLIFSRELLRKMDPHTCVCVCVHLSEFVLAIAFACCRSGKQLAGESKKAKMYVSIPTNPSA
jgi:hypothetical protein